MQQRVSEYSAYTLHKELAVKGYIVDEIAHVSSSCNDSDISARKAFFAKVERMLSAKDVKMNYSVIERAELKWTVPVAGATKPPGAHSASIIFANHIARSKGNGLGDSKMGHLTMKKNNSRKRRRQIRTELCLTTWSRVGNL